MRMRSSEQLSRHEIAAVLGASRSHLSRILRKAPDRTPTVVVDGATGTPPRRCRATAAPGRWRLMAEPRTSDRHDDSTGDDPDRGDDRAGEGRAGGEPGPVTAAAAGDAGTALGAAMAVAHDLGDRVGPLATAALGRGWADDELQAWLDDARVAYHRPDDIAEVVAGELAADRIVAWFQGRAEFGPRALGHRSLLADPRKAANVDRLNAVKGREQFRPVAPMVLLDRAADVFDGALPSPHMLFVHRVRSGWRDAIPAAVHVDGTARAQTVDAGEEPLVARMLAGFERRTGVPVVINTSLNTAGRPIVDDPRDALECFGSAPIDVLALGPFLVRRPGVAA
jgi:hypothetical protein